MSKQILNSFRFNSIKILLILICVFTQSHATDLIRTKNGMVVSASEIASRVGVQILKKGGNAVDAAVATELALAVTFPAAGNLGGGGFMVIRLNDGTTTTIDYREKAPFAAHKDMFLDENGNFVPELSQSSILGVGIPGTVAGVIYALEKYGTMKLADVIQPAINLAEDGFPLERWTAQTLSSAFRSLEKYESSMKVFSKNGEPYKEGEIFRQPDLTKTLKAIRDKGHDGFYKGWVADAIVAQSDKMNGIITHKDLEKYQAVEREPLKGTYKDYQIISMGPSSSGGTALIKMLNILENFDFERSDFSSSKYYHALIQSMKYAYADRAEHLGDEDFYPVPKKWLISKEYAKEIFQKITDSATPSDEISAGIPFNESDETTHYSVYDRFGNAVSTTLTINSLYGSKIVVDGAGFLLNNEMDDFSAKPGVPNQFGLLGSKANSIEPGKRMLSAMTPTIVLKDDKPVLIVGSPGGSTIITSVLQVVMNVIEFNMNLREAVDLPRIHHQWKPDLLEHEPFALNSDTEIKLKEKGHIIGRQRSLGRIEAILIDQQNGYIYGKSDGRAWGKAVGY